MVINYFIKIFILPKWYFKKVIKWKLCTIYTALSLTFLLTSFTTKLHSDECVNLNFIFELSRWFAFLACTQFINIKYRMHFFYTFCPPTTKTIPYLFWCCKRARFMFTLAPLYRFVYHTINTPIIYVHPYHSLFCSSVDIVCHFCAASNTSAAPYNIISRASQRYYAPCLSLYFFFQPITRPLKLYIYTMSPFCIIDFTPANTQPHSITFFANFYTPAKMHTVIYIWIH